MSRPIRRGRLDVLDRVRPGLADSTRSLLRRAGAPTPADPTATDAFAAAARALLSGPGSSAAATTALEGALTQWARRPGPEARRLLLAASGRVRADGAGVPQGAGLIGVPADEAARLAARLATRPATPC